MQESGLDNPLAGRANYYLICSVPRSGSNLLAETLAATGVAGRPIEYFNRRYERRFLESWGCSAYTTYAEFIRLAIHFCRTANGVFGAKIQWYQTDDLVNSIRRIQGYENYGLASIATAFFPGVRYIWIKRADKLRQAISYSRAIQSNTWWAIDGLTDEGSNGCVPVFDFAEIESLRCTLIKHEECWQSYFEECGVTPLVLRYEDLWMAPEKQVAEVLDYLNIDIPGGLSLPPPRLKKQSDHVTEEWLRLYEKTRRRTRAVVLPFESDTSARSAGQ